MASSIGKIFTVTSFGESHGKGIGTVIDGCPSGIAIGVDEIQMEVDRRKTILSTGGTPRQESDKVEIISGIYGGFTTGAPICLLIWNNNAESDIYDKNKYIPRPGHADYPAFEKFGGYNDFRGGGMFSGRITATYVMAGAVAKKILNKINIRIFTHTLEIGNIKAKTYSLNETINNSTSNSLRCADPDIARDMLQAIEQAGKEGDSLGGIIEGIAINVPVGLGEPVFDTLDGELAKALFSIPAVKGVEFGSGFLAAKIKGSENNDPYYISDNQVRTTTNNSGGILGGLSNGMPLIVRVAIKPTPSISKNQSTIDMKNLQPAQLSVTGRHDICIVPRAVVIVEAMIAITLCDFALIAGLIPGAIK